MEPLCPVDQEPADAVELRRRLDALGDDLQVEGPAQGHDRLGDPGVLAGPSHRADHGPRDLDDIDGVAAEIAHGQEPQAEAIDGEPDAERLELRQTRGDGGVVGHHLGLAQLQRQPGGIQAGTIVSTKSS